VPKPARSRAERSGEERNKKRSGFMPALGPLMAKARRGTSEVAEKCGLGGRSTKWQTASPEGLTSKPAQSWLPSKAACHSGSTRCYPDKDQGDLAYPTQDKEHRSRGECLEGVWWICLPDRTEVSAKWYVFGRSKGNWVGFDFSKVAAGESPRVEGAGSQRDECLI